MKKISTILLTLLLGSYIYAQTRPTLPGGNDKWQLFWNDEFSYPSGLLTANSTLWTSANDSIQSNILCARLPRNSVVGGGTLKLQNKKEKVGNKAWTSGSVWTKRTFQYGYFECRYRYAAATGTNNSFWFMTQGVPTVGKKFEIDVNEGHYPNEMNTNIHNWSDITTNPTTGAQSHPSASKSFLFGPKPDVNIQLEIPVTTRRIRLTSNYAAHFHIREFRIYNVNQSGYPTVLSPTADTDISGLINYARDAQTSITSSGVYGTGFEVINAADGGLTKSWVSQAAGPKWLEFNFPTDKTIGCIQFISGWINGSSYTSILDDYKVQYFDGTNWVDIQTADATTSAVDFGRDYHVLGLEWTKDSIIFYHDGVMKRKEVNNFCYSGAPMYLSEAIIAWAGPVTDAINGTQMEIDYVRAFKSVDPNVPYDMIINGGFETLTASLPAPWELNRANSTISKLNYQTSGQADGLRSLIINNSATLPDTFSTNVAQKVPITTSGLYEISLKVYTTGSTTGSNNISLKIANEYSGITNLMNGDNTIQITPTATWTTHKFRVNLKEDFENKVSIGVSNLGTYFLDSISMVRVGDVQLSVPSMNNINKVTISSFRQSIRIDSDSRQHIDIFGIDGKCVFASELDEGITDLKILKTGLFIVRLRNRYGVVSKKVILTSY